MAFTIHEMQKDDPQWEELFRVMCLAFEQPLQGMFRLFRPIFEPGPEADEASFKEFSHRMRFEYGGGPECIWQKVVNEEGTVVAAVLWRIHHENPFANEEDETVYWFPEGSKRRFAESALERFDAPRKKYGRRPQVFLNILGIHPSHQRQGIGSLVVKWGIQQATRLNYEMWLDASPYGAGLYRKHGFTTIVKDDISPPVTKEVEDDREWMELKENWGLMIEEAMFRPKDGEGRREKPWEDEGIKD